MKLLIVEDEEIMRKALVDTFTREGFTVVPAQDGEEGLAEALREHPDLILLDIIMPKMDGMTMLKKLRKDDWGAHAKVILLTNVSAAATVAQGIQAGMETVYEYLVKTDWTLDEIVKKVKERLKGTPPLTPPR